MSTERIWLADMFKLPIAAKAQGLRAYYLESGELKIITTNTCRNRWGKIYLLTDDEVKRLAPTISNVRKIRKARAEQDALFDELVESILVNDIINQ